MPTEDNDIPIAYLFYVFVSLADCDCRTGPLLDAP
jgi:hypothetical protein